MSSIRQVFTPSGVAWLGQCPACQQYVPLTPASWKGHEPLVHHTRWDRSGPCTSHASYNFEADWPSSGFAAYGPR